MPGTLKSPRAPAPAPMASPSNGGRRAMIGLLWFGSLATLAYWVIWFGVDRSWLATADTPAYYAFENAFPIADGWMAVTGALGAVALQRRQPSALLWMLLAGSAALYLAGMDVLFDLENGIYRPSASANGVANVAVELFINVGCLVGGIAIIAFAWRYRAHFMSLDGVRAEQAPSSSSVYPAPGEPTPPSTSSSSVRVEPVLPSSSTAGKSRRR